MDTIGSLLASLKGQTVPALPRYLRRMMSDMVRAPENCAVTRRHRGNAVQGRHGCGWIGLDCSSRLRGHQGTFLHGCDKTITMSVQRFDHPLGVAIITYRMARPGNTTLQGCITDILLRP